MADKVTTPVFRVSFPAMFEAKSFQEGEPKFSLVMIFDSKADIKAMRKLANDAAHEKFGAKLPANLKSPFRDGKEKAHLQGYGEGTIFATASSKQKPGLVDQRVQPIIDRDEFYAGCYARATVTAFAYDQKGNKGVAFGLNNVQKIRDGERFDGRTAATDDFEEVEDFVEDGDGDGAGEDDPMMK
jgi:hypothetical protein